MSEGSKLTVAVVRLYFATVESAREILTAVATISVGITFTYAISVEPLEPVAVIVTVPSAPETVVIRPFSSTVARDSLEEA